MYEIMKFPATGRISIFSIIYLLSRIYQETRFPGPVYRLLFRLPPYEPGSRIQYM